MRPTTTTSTRLSQAPDHRSSPTSSTPSKSLPVSGFEPCTPDWPEHQSVQVQGIILIESEIWLGAVLPGPEGVAHLLSVKLSVTQNGDWVAEGQEIGSSFQVRGRDGLAEGRTCPAQPGEGTLHCYRRSAPKVEISWARMTCPFGMCGLHFGRGKPEGGG
ncbi:hypothetical protein LXA43DRAFT_423125 [Ganoderma leucocontextum]|nr:hypothetical protein LXA43DRAFT_423125 [Ganoderma leucocontextum]